MLKRIAAWVFLMMITAHSANTSSDQSAAHTFQYLESFHCLADQSGHSFTLQKSKIESERPLVLNSDSSDLKSRTMKCEHIEKTYFCDWSGYYTVKINTEVRWKRQDGEFDPQNVQVTGVWQRGASHSGERIYCHL